MREAWRSYSSRNALASLRAAVSRSASRLIRAGCLSSRDSVRRGRQVMTGAADFVTDIRPDATGRRAVVPPIRGLLLAHGPVPADVRGMALPLPRLSRLLVIAATALLALMAVDVTAGLPLPAPLAPVWKWHYEAIELLAAGSLLLRAAHDRRERLAWSFLALGVVGATCGDLYWDISLAGLSTIPYPSAADALYLSFYPAA